MCAISPAGPPGALHHSSGRVIVPGYHSCVTSGVGVLSTRKELPNGVPGYHSCVTRVRCRSISFEPPIYANQSPSRLSSLVSRLASRVSRLARVRRTDARDTPRALIDEAQRAPLHHVSSPHRHAGGRPTPHIRHHFPRGDGRQVHPRARRRRRRGRGHRAADLAALQQLRARPVPRALFLQACSVGDDVFAVGGR